MLALFKTGEEIGGRKVDMSHPGWASLAALFATMAQTGFRKAEVCLAAGASWTKANISLANVSWLIDGHIVVYPTVEQLRNLKKGDYCLLRPPQSKADPLGLHWGASTIYLRFDPDAAICAAKYIAWMEITRAVPAAQRAEVPLFVNFSYGPWRAVPLTNMFKEALSSAGVPPDQLRRYSMHSWRIYLACALLAAGAPRTARFRRCCAGAPTRRSRFTLASTMPSMPISLPRLSRRRFRASAPPRSARRCCAKGSSTGSGTRRSTGRGCSRRRART